MPPFKHTPEEARKLWVEALRSGKYDDSLMGCFGVASLMFSFHERGVPDTVGFEDNPDHSEVAHWLGLSNEWGGYEGDDGFSLKGCDAHYFPLDAIAHTIESSPPGLFVK